MRTRNLRSLIQSDRYKPTRQASSLCGGRGTLVFIEAPGVRSEGEGVGEQVLNAVLEHGGLLDCYSANEWLAIWWESGSGDEGERRSISACLNLLPELSPKARPLAAIVSGWSVGPSAAELATQLTLLAEARRCGVLLATAKPNPALPPWVQSSLVPHGSLRVPPSTRVLSLGQQGLGVGVALEDGHQRRALRQISDGKDGWGGAEYEFVLQPRSAKVDDLSGHEMRRMRVG